MIQNEEWQKKRSLTAVAYRSENTAIVSGLPGLHTNHLYVSVFNCSQTSCYNFNDASLNGLALLLLKWRYMMSVCPFTMSSGFFSALPCRFSCIFCVVLSSFSKMMSLAGGIFFLSCSHQISKSKISIYRAHWQTESFLFPPPSPSIKNKMHLIAVKLQWSLWYCSLVTCFANDVTDLFLSDTAIKCC